MNTADLMIILAVILCLLVSFLFSGSETALTASSRASMLRLGSQGSPDATIVNRLLADREQLIGALLIGNNVATIAGSTLATGLFLNWFGDVGVLSGARIEMCSSRSGSYPRLCRHYTAWFFLVSNLYSSAVTLIMLCGSCPSVGGVMGRAKDGQPSVDRCAPQLQPLEGRLRTIHLHDV
jgi:Cyclin M transmembrane N-terminal domain